MYLKAIWHSVHLYSYKQLILVDNLYSEVSYRKGITRGSRVNHSCKLGIAMVQEQNPMEYHMLHTWSHTCCSGIEHIDIYWVKSLSHQLSTGSIIAWLIVSKAFVEFEKMPIVNFSLLMLQPSKRFILLLFVQ